MSNIDTAFITEVFDPQGNKVMLGEKMASGGEGAVYPISGRNSTLVKIYHTDILKKRGLDLNRKIEVMVDMKDKFKGKLCWPSVRAFNAQNQWVGYAMRRAEGVTMFKMAHPMIYKNHFLNLDRVQVVNYLINFLDKVAMLHSNDVMMGDYNLNNILCNPHSDQVDLIDCDSYQIHVGGQLFRNPVGSPDLTAPEQQGKDFGKIDRTVESELFSVAIILFKCLMLGRHPYDAVGGDDPIQNIKKRAFPVWKRVARHSTRPMVQHLESYATPPKKSVYSNLYRGCNKS